MVISYCYSEFLSIGTEFYFEVAFKIWLESSDCIVLFRMTMYQKSASQGIHSKNWHLKRLEKNTVGGKIYNKNWKKQKKNFDIFWILFWKNKKDNMCKFVTYASVDVNNTQ